MQRDTRSGDKQINKIKKDKQRKDVGTDEIDEYIDDFTEKNDKKTIFLETDFFNAILRTHDKTYKSAGLKNKDTNAGQTFYKFVPMTEPFSKKIVDEQCPFVRQYPDESKFKDKRLLQVR